MKFKIQNHNSIFKILFVGRLEKDTGVPIYLNTLEILKSGGIDFEFEACGDGNLRQKVEKFGKVHGFVENLSFYIQKANIVFASSYLSIFEAMVNKRLVFAIYDNPLKEDYLRLAPFSQFIVIEADPQRVADRIEYLLQRPEEATPIIEKGYKWVKDQSWENIVNVYLKLWNEDIGV